MNTRLKNIGVATLLALLVGATIYALDSRAREDDVRWLEQKFALLAALRKSALDAYLTTVRGEITFWSVSDEMRVATQRLEESWLALSGDRTSTLQDLYIEKNPYPLGERARLADAGDGSAYSRAHLSLHGLAGKFVSGRGYYDFFVIDLSGNILYSVKKEADFATSLADGPYRDSALANVYRWAAADENNSVYFSDLARYAPSDDAPAIFVAQRMVDEDGRPTGVMAMQLPTSQIVDIMQFDEGMGASGETYLVGQDMLMRSDSRFSSESTVLNQRADTETVQRALAGEKGIDFTPDYRGVSVLSAYDWIDIGEYRWAVMAEIDEDEIRQSSGGLSGGLIAVGALLYALLLWTVGLFGALIRPGGAAPSVSMPEPDIGAS